MTVGEVFEAVKRDAYYYEASGGGVTASGGEILKQADFVAELFRMCRAEGISTCADTSGFGDPAALEAILEHSDLVLFDLKHMDPKEHSRACGQTNELILENLKAALESSAQIIVRIPLIPDYNTSDEAVTALAQAISDIAGGAEVEIVSYNRHGAGKYKMYGRTYLLEDLRELRHPEKTRAKEIFESFGLKCSISR